MVGREVMGAEDAVMRECAKRGEDDVKKNDHVRCGFEIHGLVCSAMCRHSTRSPLSAAALCEPCRLLVVCLTLPGRSVDRTGCLVTT